ncbi:MAG TPA: bifunctional acetate--CoA ligase family protein/GNAT family N-acetyltransferase [Caulobacterales bacterium]|nr:bifunctional acetate--CoA ligase family protein/GNAT family N-acetyltransferase [Caulobacterales bacterium]
MTTRNLDALFTPKTIALIGASNRAGSVGAVIARNLLAAEFSGEIMLVNPHEAEVQGVRAFASVDDLPNAPELAVIATPPATIPDLIEQLGQRGCRAAIVITAGLSAEQRQAMFDAACPRLLRIVGPNCLGLLSPGARINASFSHLAPLKGDIAFLTQSGAIATSIIDWANGRGVGFSHIVSLGDMSDVDFGDLLDFLAFDRATKAILLYVESVTQARKFMSAARIAARAKPVIVVKAGRSASGARAATSHTGALAGADIVYDAAFRRAGMLRVAELRDLFDAAETLASGLRVDGERLAILTNGGGLGVMGADALDAAGGKLATLSAETASTLDAKLPRAWSHGNPVDIIGDADGARYEAALGALADEKNADAILVMNCPTGVADTMDAAEAMIRVHARRTGLPMLGCWMGEATAESRRARLSEAGIPNYETPEEAVRAFMQLAEYARNQEALLETPPASAVVPQTAREEARAIIAGVIGEGRSLLTEFEAKRVLALYGVPVVETVIVKTPDEAADRATRMHEPFALKILSPDITHKTDVGGVALNLESAEAVRTAAEHMLTTVSKAVPAAHIDGFTLQPMIVRPKAQELIIGVSEDRTFGPTILFGQGGIAVEVLADRVVGLPPLNTPLARGMVARTRVAKLLAGYRDRPPADIGAIADALVAVSNLVIDFPEIAELDINPLLADADGALALDARIVVAAATTSGDARLAIRPYPAGLAHDLALPGCAALNVRPIRPDDAAALTIMAQRTKPEDLRLRFHGVTRELAPGAAARLTQIDYDREMAFIAIEPDGSAVGVARLVFDPDFSAAEFAIIVRSDLQGHGLGRALLSDLISYAARRGALVLWGDVLAENATMLAMAREMGASRMATEDGEVRVQFDLSRPQAN